MRTKTVVSWSPDDDDDDNPETCAFDKVDRKRARSLVAGLEGLGTIPPEDVFPPRGDEGRIDDDADRRWIVGQRIANRLCSGEWHDEAFLTVARDWVASVQTACYEQTEEWWATQIAQPHAGLLAQNSRANGDRIQEVIDAVDEMIGLVRTGTS